MKQATIDDIVYEIKTAAKNEQNKPIVFLGAGASATGHIPLVSKIIEDILTEYADSPKIRRLSKEERTYPKLMECLSPFERNKLLKKYIDNAKINVTHIYLAQLLNEGYIDYVLTVNFDNLMLRALSLYNVFPKTYDMAILKDLTTTTFEEKSIVYLHGQHHGLWLLNTSEEMAKVRKVIPPILNKLSDERAWIFIGYSGEDPIFEHIVNLGRFDNGLYWVTYKDTDPNEKVCRELLEKENTNSYIVKGYDADSFMVKLCNELEFQQPNIIDKPFTMLSSLLENIVDINEEEHYKGVKERLEIDKKQVQKAINQFEDGNLDRNAEDEKDNEVDLLKKQLIKIITDNKFDENEINEAEEKAKVMNNEEINELIANVYNAWGNEIFDLAEFSNKEELFLKSIGKYQKAAEVNPNDASIFCNWGYAIHRLARLKVDEKLYLESFNKYEKATTINAEHEDAFNRWGIATSELARLKQDESWYKQCFEKYEKAIKIKPKSSVIISNLGYAISELAVLKGDEGLFFKSFEKFKEAADVNPKYDMTFYNWGNAIIELGKLKADKTLFEEAFNKYRKATEVNPKCTGAFNNWGKILAELAEERKDEKLYEESFSKFQRALDSKPKYIRSLYNLGNATISLAKLKDDQELYEKGLYILKETISIEPGSRWDFYDIARCHSLIGNKEEAFKGLDDCLAKNYITVAEVERSPEWSKFKGDSEFIELINKYGV